MKKFDQPDMFESSIVNLMLANREKFTEDFVEWLPKNLHVWDAFVEHTIKVIDKGFEHYSAYTIVEFLRHHSAISENAPGSDWKINNNYRPYLARLFDLACPQHAGLFEYRETKKAIAENA